MTYTYKIWKTYKLPQYELRIDQERLQSGAAWVDGGVGACPWVRASERSDVGDGAPGAGGGGKSGVLYEAPTDTNTICDTQFTDQKFPNYLQHQKRYVMLITLLRGFGHLGY